jgi:hypothetical protein
MVLKIDGLWKIVGFVSACITKPDHCDLNNYLVYTDVSKFNSWIERVIIESQFNKDRAGQSNKQSYSDDETSAGQSVLAITFQMKLFFFIFLSVFFFKDLRQEMFQ